MKLNVGRISPQVCHLVGDFDAMFLFTYGLLTLQCNKCKS